jgi:hypothetical protein
MIRKLGIGGGFAAVVIATGGLLWCDGSLAAETQAILLRGYLGLFSDGLDRLAQELRARGINAEVRKHLYWTTAVSDILRERDAGKIGALILMGHSQGGNDAIEIARALEISHVPVDLLVTFDPFRQKPVPAPTHNLLILPFPDSSREGGIFLLVESHRDQHVITLILASTLIVKSVKSGRMPIRDEDGHRAMPKPASCCRPSVIASTATWITPC